LLIFLATELGFAQRFFNTTSLTGRQWLIAIGIALVFVLIEEVVKFFIRRASK
jgi:Ca2+-transporting ATPase